MIDLTQERDVDTLRQISRLLDREVQRLLIKNLQLTTDLARLRGVPDPEQLALAERRALEQRRAQALAPPADATATQRPGRRDRVTGRDRSRRCPSWRSVTSCRPISGPVRRAAAS